MAQAIEMAEHKPVHAVMADNLKGVELPEGHLSYEDYVAGQPEENPETDCKRKRDMKLYQVRVGGVTGK